MQQHTGLDLLGKAFITIMTYQWVGDWPIQIRPIITQKNRGDWIRTSDLLNPIQARFRPAPRPVKNFADTI